VKNIFYCKTRHAISCAVNFYNASVGRQMGLNGSKKDFFLFPRLPLDTGMINPAPFRHTKKEYL
jgi:hypothetical protein